MQSLQPVCKQCHPAIESDLAQPCLQEINTPNLRRHRQDDAAMPESSA